MHGAAVTAKVVIPRPKIAADGMKHGAKKLVIPKPKKPDSRSMDIPHVAMKHVGIRPAIALSEPVHIAKSDKRPIASSSLSICLILNIFLLLCIRLITNINNHLSSLLLRLPIYQ